MNLSEKEIKNPNPALTDLISSDHRRRRANSTPTQLPITFHDPMRRTHLHCLFVGGFLCLLTTTYFLLTPSLYHSIINSPPPTTTTDTTATTTTTATHQLTQAHLHDAITSSIEIKQRLSSKKGSDADRLQELESQITEWSTLLVEAKIEMDVKTSVSNKKIKNLEEKLHKKELQQRRTTAKLLTKLTTSSRAHQHTAGDNNDDDNNNDNNDDNDDGLPNLRIYVYDMPYEYTKELSDAEPNCKWNAPYTWQTKYTLETYMHDTLLKSSIRTMDPEEAHLFYVPIFVGCYLHHIGTNFDKASTKIINGVNWIKKNYPYWERTQGRDHIFTFTHDIGGCVAPFRALKHAIMITNTGELHNRKNAFEIYTGMYTKGYSTRRDLSLPCFNPWKDIVAPPMINDQDMIQWHVHGKKDPSLILKRNLLATFRGTLQNYFIDIFLFFFSFLFFSSLLFYYTTIIYYYTSCCFIIMCADADSVENHISNIFVISQI